MRPQNTIRYWVRFKCPGMLFWRFAFGIVGDSVGKHSGAVDGENRIVLTKHNGKTWDLPYSGTKLVYSKRRAAAMAANMAKEAGQPVV